MKPVIFIIINFLTYKKVYTYLKITVNYPQIYTNGQNINNYLYVSIEINTNIFFFLLCIALIDLYYS